MKQFKIALIFLLCVSCSTKSTVESPERTTLFEVGEAGSRFYRIPALTQAADGALVAIADQRGSRIDDLPNVISLVFKRSTDYGKTWSELSTVIQGDPETQCGYGDACLIADKQRGTLVVVFAGNNGTWQSNEERLIRTYTSISRDNGKSWEKATDITDQVYSGVYGSNPRYGLFAASGSGLQLKQGKHAGRLMCVVEARNDSTWGGTFSNYAIYSDDGGTTWQVSRQAAHTDGDEAKVVELPNGDILMSIRNRAQGHRLFSTSTDGGETWSEATLNTTIFDPTCNGDMVSYTHNGKQLLLHSIPASPTNRENVTVYVSEDNGITWEAKRCIHKGYSAYSSLQVLDDGTIGIVVEEGMQDEQGFGFNLVFYRFSLDWLLEGDL